MFWSRKPDTASLGVPLGDLMAMLAPTSIEATIQGSTLLARHEQYTVRVVVVPPDVRETEDGTIRAVVRLLTDLPVTYADLCRGKEVTAASDFNAFAALGALYRDDGMMRIGSRLTIYDGEDAWKTLQLPLLAMATINGPQAILGALRRALGKESFRGGASLWTAPDLAHVEHSLSTLCVCATGGLGLTAEFGLSGDAMTALDGDHATALFQMKADKPHPELGGGLFCHLQMPHRVREPGRLAKICATLNEMEMQAGDLPPHFGAWCPGRPGHNPSYVAFLPNALHSVSGIALNTAIWAANRAQWAHAMLAAVGIKA